MPQMGLEVTEGTVVTIHVEVGAQVSEGDAVVEMETDKALSEIPAPRGGFVHAIEVEVGDTVAVGATLLQLGDEAPVTGAAQPSNGGDAVPAAKAVATPAANGGGATDARSSNGVVAGTAAAERILAAPVARRAAEQLGVPLATVTGTGPRGRITLQDVEAAAASTTRTMPSTQAPGSERLEPMSATRRAVARRMTESQQLPQFALRREIEAGWLLSEKERLAVGETSRVNVNDLLVQALAETLTRHPDLAASYVEGEDGRPQLLRPAGVDVGLAVATDRGLLVPVIRGAHERPLSELAADRIRLVEAARKGRLALDEMSGANVTISNLGAAGVDSFNAMINPGEAAILAVGRIVERVVPRERGIAIAPMLMLTLTLDHRVVDGATGGAALGELASLLEGEMSWRP
jgi:pyruvate dehydrogenase E2 component (dihydrolipoamide acetyltransferase)